MRGANGGFDLTFEVIKLSSAAVLFLAGIVSIVARTV